MGLGLDQEGTTPREIAPGATFAPVPAWVDLQPYTIPPTANPYFISAGLSVLLDESVPALQLVPTVGGAELVPVTP